MNERELAALGELMVKFKEITEELKELFIYVDSRFQVADDKVLIVLKADNEPRLRELIG